MDKCSICGEETPLYSGNIPICLKCDKEQQRKAKDHVASLLQEASERAEVRANDGTT
jgi:hypothetical protein